MTATVETVPDHVVEAMARSHYESRITALGVPAFWFNLPKSARQQEIAAMREALEHIR